MKLNNVKRSSLILFLILILITLILEIIGLPVLLQEYRPDLLSLVLIYFTLYEKKKYGLEIAWFFGLILDLLTGAPLGINAAILAAEIYILSKFFTNFIKYRSWQQSITIGLICYMAHVVSYWFEHLIGQSFYETSFIYPAIATAIAWIPVVYICSILKASLSIETNNQENQS